MARHHSKTQSADAFLDEKATKRDVIHVVANLMKKHEDLHHAAAVARIGKATFGKPSVKARILGALRRARGEA